MLMFYIERDVGEVVGGRVRDGSDELYRLSHTSHWRVMTCCYSNATRNSSGGGVVVVTSCACAML